MRWALFWYILNVIKNDLKYWSTKTTTIRGFFTSYGTGVQQISATHFKFHCRQGTYKIIMGLVSSCVLWIYHYFYSVQLFIRSYFFDSLWIKGTADLLYLCACAMLTSMILVFVSIILCIFFFGWNSFFVWGLFLHCSANFRHNGFLLSSKVSRFHFSDAFSKHF